MEKTSPLSFGGQGRPHRRFNYFTSLQASQLRVRQPRKQRRGTDFLEITRVHD